MKSCANCLLWRKDWQQKEHEHGVCVWFLKKLKVPKPVPADVYAKGCANWKAGKTAKEQGIV